MHIKIRKMKEPEHGYRTVEVAIKKRFPNLGLLYKALKSRKVSLDKL